MSRRSRNLNTGLTQAEWGLCLRILSEFGIYVAQMMSDAHLAFLFEEYGSAPGNACSPRIRTKTKGDRLILMESSRGRPTLETVCDVLHEAAHIILNDYNRGEDEGVAQVELILAFMVCPKLWKRMVVLHRDIYSWDQEYAELKQTKRWLRWQEKAIGVVSGKFPDFDAPLKDAFLSPWARKTTPEGNSPTPLGTRL